MRTYTAVAAVKKFADRVDALPIGEVSPRQIRLRIALLEDDLARLTTDEAHVLDQCSGVEQVRHLQNIRRERAAAKEKLSAYAGELKLRTP